MYIHNDLGTSGMCPKCSKPLTVTGLMESCRCFKKEWPQMPSQGDLVKSINIGMPKVLPSKEGSSTVSMAQLYPKYYKDVSDISVLDVYGVHKLFNINDPSGAIQHASKKLLLSGVRTGGKSTYDDIREARDTLNRWLELNKPKGSNS